VSVKLDDLRVRCKRAQDMPSEENTFRRLHLNQWTEQDTRWLRMEHWAQGNKPCPVMLDGRECFAGLDLKRLEFLGGVGKKGEEFRIELGGHCDGRKMGGDEWSEMGWCKAGRSRVVRESSRSGQEA